MTIQRSTALDADAFGNVRCKPRIRVLDGWLYECKGGGAIGFGQNTAEAYTQWACMRAMNDALSRTGR